MDHATKSTDEAEASDRSKMVNCHRTADRRIVMNMTVASEHRAVGHDHTVSDFAVVGDVDASHQEAMATKLGDAIFLFRGSIDRDTFSNNVVVTEHHAGPSPVVAHILRLSANDCPGMNVVVGADDHSAFDDNVAFQRATVADFGIRSNDTERADGNVLANFRARIDRCQIRNSCSHGLFSGDFPDPVTCLARRRHSLVRRSGQIVFAKDECRGATSLPSASFVSQRSSA